MSVEAGFGEYLKELRSGRELTQGQLADLAGCSRSSIRKFELGVRRPSRQIAELLADCLSLQPEERTRFLRLARTERTHQTISQIAPATSETPHSAETTPAAQLPVSLVPIIGREKELAALQDRLTEPQVRLLTMEGPPGIGKTRLAIEAASTLGEHFPGGVYYVPLAAISDANIVPEEIAQTLGIRDTTGEPPQVRIARFLEGKRALLMLDNFEHVIGAATFVSDLLARCADLKIAVTSREALHVRGERVFAVPPLAMPDPAGTPDPDELREYAAVALFVERARAVRGSFEIEADNAGAVASLCARLDGLPLAIELVAARSKLLTPQALLSRLDNLLALLSSGPRDLPTRHKTLSAAIVWSYDLLSGGEQKVFARLGVFAGGCTIQAAEAVCAAPGESEVGVLDALSSLLDKNLLKQVANGDESRFTMLETIREFAQERLQFDEGEASATWERYACYYLGVAQEADRALLGAKQNEWMQSIEREHDNFRAVLRRSLERGDVERAVRVSGALWRFWNDRGYWSEGRRWLEDLLALLSATGSQLNATYVARAMRGTGDIALNQGDSEAGQVLLRALDLYRQANEPSGIASVLVTLGWMVLSRSNLEQATTYATESLELSRGTGDIYGIADALQLLGHIAQHSGDMAAANEYFEEALALSRALGHRRQYLSTLNSLGEMARGRGDHTRAGAIYAECLAISRELGHKRSAAHMLHNLAYVAQRTGDPEQARLLFNQALKSCRELGDVAGSIECVSGLAGVTADLGDQVGAARLLGAATALFKELGYVWSPADQAEYDRNLATVRDRLPEPDFSQSWEHGAAMNLEQATSYALSE